MILLPPRPRLRSRRRRSPHAPTPPVAAPRHRDLPGLAVLAALLVGIVTHAPHTTAQEPIAAFEEENGANKIELVGVFAPPPPTGYLPLRVQLTNATGEKRSWKIDAHSSVGYMGGSQTRSSFEVAAEPGSTQSTLLVPVHGAVSTSSWRYGGAQHQFEVSVSSSNGGRHSTTRYSERALRFPAIAISDALAQKSLTQLNDEAGNVGGSGYGHEKTFGSRFLPEQLPDSWLGYSGFDHVMMTADEWLAVAPGVRSAILQAAHFGLQIHLYRSNASVALGALGFVPPNPDDTTLAHGMGRVVLDTWDGTALDAAVTVAKFAPLKSAAIVEQLSNDFASARWGLKQALGERSFAGWQVVIFLLLFGLLVGPVNLFVLAPVGKRHKLFFTTPLISLAASLLLIGLILIQDGTGGVGRRFVAIHLPPGEAAAHVTQEQIARTGVVLGSSFSLPRPGTISQVVLQESPWAKFHTGNGSQPVDARIDGVQIGGNWFQSRALQGQCLRSVVPTRGRIEVLPPKSPGAPPSIVSSLEFDLATFGYLDAGGTMWRSEGPVTQGRPVTLVQDTMAWTDLLRGIRDVSSEGLATRIGEVATNRPAFVATAQAAPGFAIDTLPSIRWSDDRIVVFGNLPAQP